MRSARPPKTPASPCTEASEVQIIEHVVEVPQIQCQEVVRHVTVPQVMTQENLEADVANMKFDAGVWRGSIRKGEGFDHGIGLPVAGRVFV